MKYLISFSIFFFFGCSSYNTDEDNNKLSNSQVEKVKTNNYQGNFSFDAHENFCTALDNCNYALMKKLLESGANPNTICYDATAILMCAECKDNAVPMAKIMVEHGANINSVDGENASLFTYAVLFDNYELVDFLLDKGIEKNSRDNNLGCSAIHACQSVKMLQRLEKEGFDWNEKCENGRSLLHFTAKDSLTDLAKYILKRRGIEINLADKNGKTPFDYSIKYHNSKMVEILRKAGGLTSHYMNSIKDKDGNIMINSYPEYQANYETEILTTGIFHNDEISKDAQSKRWFGLFKKDNAEYYLSKTKIKIRSHFDIVLDTDSANVTGWNVQTDSKDSVIALIGGANFLKNNAIGKAALMDTQILPEDTLKLSYLGRKYQLFASGKKVKDSYNDTWYITGHYKLYLKSMKNGEEITELLCAYTHFDDGYIDLIFGGDMDGDGRLDLIIDNSPKYNSFTPTVYLSSQAREDQLLKIVGMGKFVGC